VDFIWSVPDTDPLFPPWSDPNPVQYRKPDPPTLEKRTHESIMQGKNPNLGKFRAKEWGLVSLS
jgi:hypothetical protein